MNGNKMIFNEVNGLNNINLFDIELSCEILYKILLDFVVP